MSHQPEDPAVTAEWEAEKAATAQRARQCRAEHPASGRNPGHPGEHEEVDTGITWQDPPPSPFPTGPGENTWAAGTAQRARQMPTGEGIGWDRGTIQRIAEFLGRPDVPGCSLEADQLRNLLAEVDALHAAEQSGELLECAAAGLDVEQTIRHHALTHAIHITGTGLSSTNVLTLADVYAAYIRDGSRP